MNQKEMSVNDQKAQVRGSNFIGGFNISFDVIIMGGGSAGAVLAARGAS